MKQVKTIPFNWELYNNNRDKYTVIHSTSGKKLIKLSKYEGVEGVYEGSDSWDYKFDQGVDPYNLQLQYEEDVVESWVNLYKGWDGVLHTSPPHRNEQSAREAAIGIKGYIKTINLNELI